MSGTFCCGYSDNGTSFICGRGGATCPGGTSTYAWSGNDVDDIQAAYHACMPACIPKLKPCCVGYPPDSDCGAMFPEACNSRETGRVLGSWGSRITGFDLYGSYIVEPACEVMRDAIGWEYEDGNPCDTRVACCTPWAQSPCQRVTLAQCFGFGGALPPDPEDGGLAKYCTDDIDCDIPRACCLCDGQCEDMSTADCELFGGVRRIEAMCLELQQSEEPCDPERLPMCRRAHFKVRPSSAGDGSRYRAMSDQRMNPHEYVAGPPGENCRLWWTTMSVVYGPWSCGQWDRELPETKLYFQLRVRFLQTGHGRFWAEYRPVCPNYGMAEELN